MWQRILCVSVAISCAIAVDNEVEKLFRDMEVVPDILDEPPKEMLKIEYNDGLVVGNGEEFTPTQTKDEPKLYWTSEHESYYTVIMVNPDIPTRQNPLLREWLHWLVVNVPGADIAKGDIIDPYIGPMAPKMSGVLRYVFLIYKQPGKQMFDEAIMTNTDVTGHEKFSSMGFAGKYNMELVAGNLFQSRWDELVPRLHKQFGIVL
uniref:Putative odorant-binding protein A5-2 n=1 Tax=Zeugodacus tau TaxID=137263 RepID=A0A1D6Y6K2_ZEUTA|nr:putative odorant-binding protein A5-2 [Zeugodacus tau]